MTSPLTVPALAEPFANMLPHMGRMPAMPSRTKIDAMRHTSEYACITELLSLLTITAEQDAAISAQAEHLATILHTAPRSAIGTLLEAFPPDSAHGQALLALAEAFLRIPDHATREALIDAQVRTLDWATPTSKTNAPTLVSMLTKGLSLASHLRKGSAFSLRRLTLQTSAPLIRHGLEKTLRAAAEEVALGTTPNEALRAAQNTRKRGFSHTFDLCCPAALNTDQAHSALHQFEALLEACSRHSGMTGGRPERPTLTLRPTLFCPHFSSLRHDQIMEDFLPTLTRLAERTRQLDLGLILTVEHSKEIDLCLDLLTALCAQRELEGWDGLGMTVQSHDRRALAITQHLIALGRSTGRRLIVRLTRGAAWRAEQNRDDTLAPTPLFSRSCHTDLSYLACAQALLNNLDSAYPHFATHNPRLVAHIQNLAPQARRGDFEFECLHGLAQPLAEALRPPKSPNAPPCRLHVPIGPATTVLPALVKQLRESDGPSPLLSSAKHTQDDVIETLTASPINAAHILRSNTLHTAHVPETTDPTALPPLFELDLSDPADQRALHEALTSGTPAALPFIHPLTAAMTQEPPPQHYGRRICNPAARQDAIGDVLETDAQTLLQALETADSYLTEWRLQPSAHRATLLRDAAQAIENHYVPLLGFIIRETGKTFLSALSELRDGVTALYQAAQEAENSSLTAAPLGLIACISPWSSPFAAFMRQIAFALAAGNIVLAKPAAQTPFTAHTAIQHLHAAGIPAEALHFLPGNELVSEELVSDPRIDGVLFTGSTSASKNISRLIGDRTGRTDAPVTLIARSGGQNTLLADSSAQPGQIVHDVIRLAFADNGQNCGALRILLLQEDNADKVISLLQGALSTLNLGDPARLSTDLGPMINAETRTETLAYIDQMRRAGRKVWAAPLKEPDRNAGHHPGSYLPPTLIEIGRVADIPREVFGPVLHIRRFNKNELEGVIDAVNASGYALSFGVHSRVPATIHKVLKRAQAGNLSVNTLTSGISVHAPPFGGYGLSGCGAKLGGPLALRQLQANVPPLNFPHFSPANMLPGQIARSAANLVSFLESRDAVSARAIRQDIAHCLVGSTLTLPAAIGETRTLAFTPAGTILCAGESWPALLRAVGITLGTGNTALVLAPKSAIEWMNRLPQSLSDRIQSVNPGALPECDAMIFERGTPMAKDAAATLTAREGRIVPLYPLDKVRPEWLLHERVTCVNEEALSGAPTVMALM
ncbi:bifunctional proline dehydrogenase/pyrroline-5-carboxylate dehydrogenase [Neokomagataea thailandica NBRC 106555]|uniref:Bifunctional protein PutA n=2 Tax=Neokomagataea TaxID=1223423 RepID=A0A4Y6VBR4_9PROT|nr:MULTISPECIES: proline dehydrogenase family protein [Neokomagataea]QDH25825.1 aldehyde dehydrogenase family protein [Neokomagataea tanensis]GBR53466.1 bifunctional proline dehydrogenase/pyrroline-5-carboxylate dehydrogenase [Neokomagataea thailandica NBRC 106555]